MHGQALITTLLVAGCSGYALWNVLPAALRRRVAAWCGRPMPAAAGGCGSCEGCGGKPVLIPSTPAGVSVIHIVRRQPPA